MFLKTDGKNEVKKSEMLNVLGEKLSNGLTFTLLSGVRSELTQMLLCKTWEYYRSQLSCFMTLFVIIFESQKINLI